jgi:hypothetical protein
MVITGWMIRWPEAARSSLQPQAGRGRLNIAREIPRSILSVMSIDLKDANANPSFIPAWWTPRLAGPVIAAAVVRLTLLAASLSRVGTRALIFPDTWSYFEPGRNLLLHGRFFADGVPDLVRTPGYPLFFAIASLAGLPAAAVANVTLSVFTVITVWKLGQAVFEDSRIALVAAWIFALEPVSVANSVLLLSDTLFLALYQLSLERLAVFLRTRRLPVLATAGMWLAAATYVRPITYYLAVALALGLFLVFARMPGLRWKAPIMLLMSVLPLLAAWQMRNWVETGYSGFSSASEYNLYFIESADVIARVEHRNFIDVRKELGYAGDKSLSEQDYLSESYLARHPEQTGWNQAQRLAFMHSEVLRVIRAHDGIYLHSYLTSLSGMTFNPGAGVYINLLYPQGTGLVDQVIDYKSPASGVIALAKAYPWVAAGKAAFVAVLLGMYLLAARGVIRGGMQNPCLWLLLGTSLYFFAVTAAVMGPETAARFRLPVMPVVCILAAAGIHRTKGSRAIGIQVNGFMKKRNLCDG